MPKKKKLVSPAKKTRLEKIKAVKKLIKKSTAFYTIPGGVDNVHLVGFSHGMVRRPVGRTIFPFMEHMHRALGPETIVLAERARSTFLPKSLRKKAVEIDARFPDYYEAMIPKLSLKTAPRILKIVIKELISESLWFRKKNPLLQRQLSKDEIKALKLMLPHDLETSFGIAPSQVNEFINFAVNVRSFIMTKRLLESLKKNPHAPHLVVAGSGHTAQIQKFLENPKLFQRYERFLQRVKEKHPHKFRDTDE